MLQLSRALSFAYVHTVILGLVTVKSLLLEPKLTHKIADPSVSFVRLQESNVVLFCIPFARHNETSRRLD